MGKRMSKTVTATNDNTELQVVWGAKGNYIMHRFITNGPLTEMVTGTVDFGKKEGLWAGYATLDEQTKRYTFTKVKELTREIVEDKNKRA